MKNRKRSARSRLFLQALETRLTPTTYTVSNTNPSGSGSLADAVTQANSNPGADTIDFNATFNSVQNIPLSGVLTISGDLTITGKGSSLTTVTAAASNRILSWTTALNVSVSGLKLTGASVTLTGGAINATAAGNLTLSDIFLTGNSGGSGGGALYFDAKSTSAGASTSSITLNNCQFTSNVAGSRGGAINVANYAKSVVITDCLFDQNVGTTGGAIRFNNDPVTTTIDRSTFSGNTANIGSGGGLYFGQLGTAGSATITNTTISGNSTTTSGGGLVANLANMRIVNSTISGNIANGSFSGGGGIFIQGSATLSMFNSTVAYNSAPNNGVGGGIRNTNFTPVSLESTIVSDNTSAGAGPDVNGPVSIATANQSLISNTSGATVTGTPLTGSALLNPLAANGGPTKTHSLQILSPALNAGNNNVIPTLSNDQRGVGYPRLAGSSVDIGAFESQTSPPTVNSVTFGDGTNQRSMVKQIVVTFSEAVNFSPDVVSAFTLARTGTGGALGNVTLSANPVNGPASVVTITFSGPLTEFGSLVDGFYDLTISAGVVSGPGGALDGNNDTIPGGNYSVTGNTSNKFFRLFGDSDGSGVTNLQDFAAFRGVFNLGANDIFDFENDGNVGLSDFAQFRARFNLSP